MLFSLFISFTLAYLCGSNVDGSTVINNVRSTKDIRSPNYNKLLSCQSNENVEHVIELNLVKNYINADSEHEVTCELIRYLNSNRAGGNYDTFPLICLDKSENSAKGSVVTNILNDFSRNQKTDCRSGRGYTALKAFNVIDQMFHKIFQHDKEYLEQKEIYQQLVSMHNWWKYVADSSSCTLDSDHSEVDEEPSDDQPALDFSSDNGIVISNCKGSRSEYGSTLSKKQQSCINQKTKETKTNRWWIRYISNGNSHFNSDVRAGRNGIYSNAHFTCRPADTDDISSSENAFHISAGRSKESLLAWIGQCCESIGAETNELEQLVSLVKDECNIATIYPDE